MRIRRFVFPLARLLAPVPACALAGHPALASPPTVFSSTKEHVRAVPLTGAQHYTYWTPYIVEVSDLTPKDVIQCHAQAEVTSRYPFPVQVVRAIARTSPGGDRGVGISRVDNVNPLHGENVTPEMHHMAITTWATDTDQQGSVFYALVLEAASTGYSPGQALRVERGYGGIWCTVFD